MNIAYDLRFAVDHFTGIGTHAYALLEALLAQPGEERYTVLWHPGLPARRFDMSAIARHPRVTWVERAWRPLHPGDPLRLSAWLRRVAPDVFLSPYYLFPIGAGCPVVLTLHDVFPLARPHDMSRSGRLLFRAALHAARYATLVFTGSDFSRDELVRRAGLAPDRVRVVPLGLPQRTSATPLRRSLPDGPFAIVVGENRPRKNLALLARAWGLLDQEDPLTLVSVGRDDARYPSLEQLAATESANGGRRTHAVRSLGWTSEAELAWLYAHASLVLFPSRYEGFGFPLVEAFASNVPVLAADIPAFREVGRDAATYASPDDAHAWAAAVSRLRRDDAARDAQVAAGRMRAAELTYDCTAAHTLAALREVAMPHAPIAGPQSSPANIAPRRVRTDPRV